MSGEQLLTQYDATKRARALTRQNLLTVTLEEFSEPRRDAARSRVPTDTLLRWMRANTTIDAARALAIGFATEVPGIKPPTNVMVFL